jgi:hypothetical protein
LTFRRLALFVTAATVKTLRLIDERFGPLRGRRRRKKRKQPCDPSEKIFLLGRAGGMLLRFRGIGGRPLHVLSTNTSDGRGNISDGAAAVVSSLQARLLTKCVGWRPGRSPLESFLERSSLLPVRGRNTTNDCRSGGEPLQTALGQSLAERVCVKGRQTRHGAAAGVGTGKFLVCVVALHCVYLRLGQLATQDDLTRFDENRSSWPVGELLLRSRMKKFLST